ncbi:MAG TPA: ATP synthase subunit I [Chloroflexota bacterium]
MTNPDLAVILRRFTALTAISMLPAGAALLAAGRRDAALGLCFGALIGTLNVSILARRINRSTTEQVTQAQRVMQQGMGIRFALILLASVVVIKTTPAAVPAFLLGLVFTIALAIAVAARALLDATGPRSGPALPALQRSPHK